MKTFFILFFLLVSVFGLSQSISDKWQPLGNYATSALSFTQSNHPRMDMDKNGRPYVVYQESDIYSGTFGRALRFDGKDWVNLGSGSFFNSNISLPNIALDNNNNPYIVFYKNQIGISVHKLNSNRLEPVGNDPILPLANDFPSELSLNIPYDTVPIVFNGTTNGVRFYDNAKNSWSLTNLISSPGVTSMKTCIGKDSTAYVVWTTDGLSGESYKKRPGDAWQPTSVIPNNGYCQFIAITTDTAGIAYAVTSSSSPNGATALERTLQVTVSRLDPTSGRWIVVGEKNFSKETAAASFPSIAIDANNTPYVLYYRVGSLKVMKFDGISWINVGSPIPVNYVANNWSFYIKNQVTIKIGANNEPYILYQDANKGGKAIMKRFNGTEWVDLLNYVSKEDVRDFQIKASKNGALFISYIEKNTNKLIISKWNGNMWQELPYTSQLKATNETHSMDLDTSSYPIIFTPSSIERFNGTSFEALQAVSPYPNSPKIAVSKNNVPHILYNDKTTGLSIKKFNKNNSSWETIGSISHIGWSPSNSMAFDNTGTISMILMDNAVYRYNGTSWVNTSLPRLLNATRFSLGINNKNEAYAASNTQASTGPPANNSISSSNRIVLFKYNNNRWDSITTFSAPLKSSNSRVTLTFDDNGAPIVGAGGISTLDTLRIKKFNGNEWEQFGDGSVNEFASFSADINSTLYPDINIIVRGQSAVYAASIGERPIVKILNGQTPTVSINVSPASPTCAGASLTFTSNVTNGGSNPTYQWRRNGDTIAGATETTYITSNLNNNDTIDVIVTGSALGQLTDTSNAIVISMDSAYLFTGTTDSDWNKADNWCSGTVPSDTDDVKVLSRATLNINHAIKCKNLTIEKGAVFTLSGAGNVLYVTGTFANYGEVNISSGSSLKLNEQ